jgi:hypothetical protein
MARNPRRIESPDLATTVLVNTEDRSKRFRAYLWPSGQLTIETQPDKVFHLTAEQTADLFVFFEQPRTITRMLDVLRCVLWQRGGLSRKIILLVDRHNQPAA